MQAAIPFRGTETAANYSAHCAAAYSPRRGFETAIVKLVEALREYATAHFQAYESPIGDDGVLGEEWEQIARGTLGLLNGEAGRLDCGSVDRHVRDLASEAGVCLD